MNVHVDQAGEGEAARKIARGRGLRVRNGGDRSIRDLDGGVAAPALHRIDDGNAIELKFAFCRDWRGRRAPEAKVVEYAHRESSPIKMRRNMNVSIYSY
jgi:hypothetical protein